MSQRDDRTRLLDILEYAQIAVAMVQNRKRDDLDDDIMLALALTKAAEVIGEAANRVSETTRCKYPQIHWHEMIGTRNRLVHGYDQIDLDVLWDIATLDLPELIEQMKTIVHPEQTG
ncbi:MAG: DUF86 domain-containing protein [Phycisphaerales bacterium]|nr:DUF86 domain-containing protein [Phycisphaerales bacterium]